MKTLNNKYTKWYWKLIESRKNSIETVDTECHHIIPRSLGGSNDASNLVYLTRREHFIAHLLLSRMFNGKNQSKMRFASRQMISKYTPTSRIYEIVKRDANLAMKALWKDPEWKEKVVQERKNRLADPKERKLMSNRMLEVWERDEYRSKHRESMKSVYSCPSWTEDNRSRLVNRWNDPRERAKLLNRPRDTDEVRKKKSDGARKMNQEVWSDPIKRELRIQSMRFSAQKRKAAKAALLCDSQTDQNSLA